MGQCTKPLPEMILLTLDTFSKMFIQCQQHSKMHFVTKLRQCKIDGSYLCTYGLDELTALEHKLLFLPHETGLIELEECLRVALLLYSNLALWKTPLYLGWVRSLAHKLKSAILTLDSQNQSLDQSVHQLLLWMLCLGGQAMSGQDVLEREWWTSKLQLIIQNLNLTEWQEVVEVLKGFFYVERISERPWVRVWRAAISDSGGSMQGSL